MIRPSKQSASLFVRIVLALICFVPSLCFATSSSSTEDSTSTPTWFAETVAVVSQLFGKLHPLIVHFPITLLVVAALLEVLVRMNKGVGKKPFYKQIRDLCLVFGALSATLAVIAGHLLAAGEEFSGELADLLELHRWGGISAAALSILIALRTVRAHNPNTLTPQPSNRFGVFHSASVVAVGALLGLSAHWGALMVHGPDYFTEVFTEKAGGRRGESTDARAMLGELPPAASRKIDFAKDVKPIFDRSCANCHMGGKRKGGLNMDSRAAILAGGGDGPAAVPGDGKASLLVQLVAGSDPKRVMPSKGERLTADEIGVLRAWIDQGMLWDKEQPQPKHTPFFKAAYAHRLVPLPPPANSEHPLDRLISEYFRQKGLTETPLVDDRGFVRRAYLDAVGVLPSGEAVERFVASREANKREQLIEQLLQDNRAYADHWISFWNDHLRNDYSGPGFLHGGRKEITSWLYSALLNNLPYNSFVFDLVAPNKKTRGFTDGVVWWQGQPVDVTENVAMQAANNVAQVFMGVNLKCASCHDSFTDAWKLEDAYGMANVFAQKPLESHRCNFPIGKTAEPKFLYPEIQEISGDRGRRARMVQLGKALTCTSNGRFARTMMNRIWARLMGTGLIEPVDELDHLPWSGDILDWLAADFAANGYDLKRSIKLMMTSRAYQMVAQPSTEKRPQDFTFRGPIVRRITAEQFLDTISHRLNYWPMVTSDDFRRVVALKEETAGAKSARVTSLPFQQRFASEELNAERTSAKVSADLSGAKNFWIVAMPRYKFSDHQSRDIERKRRMKLAKEGEGATKNGVVKQEEFLALERAFLVSRSGKKIPLGALNAHRSVAAAHGVAYLEDSVPPGEEALIERLGRPFQVLNLHRPYGVMPLAAVGFDLQDQEFSRFEADISLLDLPKKGNRKYQLLVLTDLQIRSAFLDATRLMLFLGRPRREQVATVRESTASPLQAMELLGGDAITEILTDISSQLEAKRFSSTEKLFNYLYREILNRAPRSDELELLREFRYTAPTRENIEDLVWSVLMHPEVQLIS